MELDSFDRAQPVGFHDFFRYLCHRRRWFRDSIKRGSSAYDNWIVKDKLVKRYDTSSGFSIESRESRCKGV
jgi:hypothetical protein